ncbi:unnamed protein product [Mytilus coruscus]|uniref:CCHC-type domain-containing protein n=1 Tax=Mytilus coruscus TaxID=42192 RepID=A0A6J8BVB6_MYTCO|nr:unnamed protein product [Mytilus coruscus]
MVQIKQNMEDVLHNSDIVEMCETAHVVRLTITENLTNEHISLTASLPEYVAPEITSDLAGKLEYAHPCQQAFLYSRVDGENAGSINSSKIKISFEIIDSIQTSLCSITSIVYDSKDEKSSFYVVSSSENIIMKYYGDGKSRKIKDLSGKRILSLAVVSAGRILAIAEGDCNIYSLKVVDTLKISKSWKVKMFFTFSDSQIATAVNTSKVYGNIYIATTQKTDGNRINRISVLTDKKPHEILLVAEIHLETSFFPVKAIACSRGNVTVVMKRDREDDAKGCICAVKSDPNSELQWYYGGQTGTENQERIFSPTDVTETIRGNLIACDPLNNSLHILNHKGELISFIDTVNTFGIVRPLSLDAFGRRIFVGTSSRGHSSQYESETEDSEVNTLYTTDDETCHSGSDQVYEATHDLSNIETEEEEETIVLRPRSKLSKRPSPRKPGSPRSSSRYRRQNDLEKKSEPQNQGDTGVYDIIKVAIQDMTGQVVSAIQNAFTGITKQYRHTNASSEQQKHVKSIPNANNSHDSNSFSKVRKIKQSFTPNLDITSASECDETDDEVFSDACSDIDTNSIDTDIITQSKRSKSKIGFSNAKLPSFTGKEKWEVWINRRTQKPNEDTADYAAELKRIYDKAYSNRHAKIRQEDLLQRFLMGLLDNEARIHIELTKDPKTIEEAVQEVITYRETTSETQEGNSGKNTKVRQLKKQNNQSSQKSDQTVEKKQNTNFNKQGSTNTENDVISVTKDELQKMFDQMYENKKRNDETQTSVTGHNHHDERQFDRQPFNVNAPSYVPNGNYRKNNSDRNNNPENIPKCYYCGQPGHYARKCYSNPNRQTDYRNNKATPPRQMNKPYTPPNSNSSMLQERVNTADQELALKFNENGHKLDNIGVHEPTSSITLFSNSHSKEENISNSRNISNSNSKEENTSNSGNISNSKEENISNSKEENNSNSRNISNSKEENTSNSGNISNSKEENISNSGSNSNSKEENISNSNSKEENISNRENIVKRGDNSNTSSVTLEDKNLVCSTPILGSEQSIASNVIARQVLRSDGVYVEGHIQGSEVNFTVDTGAVRTVLSVHAFNKIPLVNRPILEKSNTLACAHGKPLKELGKAIFEIKLGNLCFSTEMIVANIEDEALLD